MTTRFLKCLQLHVLVCASLATWLAIGECSAAASPKNSPQKNAPLTSALQHDLAAYLKERGEQKHLSSLSLAVSFRPDQPTITVTSGTTSFGGTTPVTPASLYQIGRNTKTFTAGAVLQLEAQGKLLIDAGIGKYLPQYPAYAKLKLRELLSMTGGLESYDNLPLWETSYAHHPMANVSADALIRSVYPHIKSPPGSKYYYSNTGYLIAQEVVAAVSSSKSYQRWPRLAGQKIPIAKWILASYAA